MRWIADFRSQNQISFEIGGRLRRTNENAPLCAPLDGSINAHVGAQNAIQTHPERSFFDGTANIRNALSSGWHFWLSCILFSI